MAALLGCNINNKTMNMEVNVKCYARGDPCTAISQGLYGRGKGQEAYC